jgi:hypothetical protein
MRKANGNARGAIRPRPVAHNSPVHANALLKANGIARVAYDLNLWHHTACGENSKHQIPRTKTAKTTTPPHELRNRPRTVGTECLRVRAGANRGISEKFWEMKLGARAWVHGALPPSHGGTISSGHHTTEDQRPTFGKQQPMRACHESTITPSKRETRRV